MLACVVMYGFNVWRLASIKTQARNAVRSEIQAKGVALAETIAVTSREDVRNSNYEKLQDYFADLVKQPDLQYLIVMKMNGEAAVHTDAKFKGKRLNDALALSALKIDELNISDDKDKQLFDIAIPVMGFTSRAAIIRIGISYGRAKQVFAK